MTELSTPGAGCRRLSGTLKRSSELGMPSIFTSKIGAANAP